MTAAPFNPLAAGLMALASLFAFCAAVLLFAYAPDLRQGDDGGAHALSRSAVGFAGLAEALRLSGQPVVVNRAALPRDAGAGLLIVTPTPTADRKALDGLGFAGPVLVVAPKWLVEPSPHHRGWVQKGALIDPAWFPKGSLAAQAGMSRRIGLSHPRLTGRVGDRALDLAVGPVDAFQSLAAPGWTPLLRDETGAVILARAPDRSLYLLSDPDLLNTQSLRDIDTLRVALTLLASLRAGDGPYIFDVRLNGLGRERSPLRLLFDPPFLAATLCLAAAAALAGFQAFCRFGPSRPGGRAIALGKAALVDNTAALIRLAGREHRMGGRYADLTADIVARAVGAPRGLGGEALVAFLDRLAARRRPADSLAELGVQARMSPTPERLTEVARRLFDWRLAMTGAAATATAPFNPKPDESAL